MRTNVWKRLAATLVVGALVSGIALPSVAASIVGQVNVNTASTEELQQLPGVGAARAQAVIDAREARGGFTSVDDLLEVKGIGAASLEALRPHVTTDGPSTAQIVE